MACIAIFALLFSSCSKEEDPMQNTSADKATLSFGVSLNDLLNKQPTTKSHFSDVPECSDAEPATVTISGRRAGSSGSSTFTLDVLSDDLDGDGNMDYYTDYSEDLELEPGQYILEEFIVYDDDGNVIWVAPIDDDDSGEYDGYVDNALPMEIDLKAGVKKYVDVEVLCFDDREVNQYGYLFFDLIPKKLHELCFFVNYCADNGRHYTANYSLDLWYVNDDDDDNNMQIIDGDMPNTGMNNDGDYFANPLCVAVPEPIYGEAAEDDYLYYELTLEDWDGNYGDVDNSATISGYLSWADVQEMLDRDGDDTTVDYLHLSFNCGDDDGNGNGNGGECDLEDPNADCDNDNVPNGQDQCEGFDDNMDYDGDGVPDGCDDDIDGDGVPNDVDECPETPLGVEVDEFGCEVDDSTECEFTITVDCTNYYLNGNVSEPTVIDDPAFFLGDNFNERVATITIDWSIGGDIFYVINMIDGYTLQDYQIKIYSDAALSNEICRTESGLDAEGEGAAEGTFNVSGAFSDVFYASIVANVCGDEVE